MIAACFPDYWIERPALSIDRATEAAVGLWFDQSADFRSRDEMEKRVPLYPCHMVEARHSAISLGTQGANERRANARIRIDHA